MNWGDHLEHVEGGRGRTRDLKLTGTLDLAEELLEIQLSPPPAVTTQHRAGTVRAFVVRNNRLVDSGLKPGDHVLLDGARDLFADPLVLARVAGGYRLQIASRVRASHPEAEILGAFIGIIRKQGFAGKSLRTPLRDAPRTRECILQGRLAMLEATCSETHNPRLRRALKNEAENVRRELRTAAGRN